MLGAAMLLMLATADQAPPVELPPPRAKIALTATGVTLLTTAAGLGVGILIESSEWRARGVPQVGWFSLATCVSFLTGAALTHWLVPWSLHLVDSDALHGYSAMARERGLRWSIVPLATGVLGSAALFIGSAMEANAFGSGQALLLAGMATVLLSAIVHQVLEIIGVSRGYADSWSSTTLPAAGRLSASPPGFSTAGAP